MLVLFKQVNKDMLEAKIATRSEQELELKQYHDEYCEAMWPVGGAMSKITVAYQNAWYEDSEKTKLVNFDWSAARGIFSIKHTNSARVRFDLAKNWEPQDFKIEVLEELNEALQYSEGDIYVTVEQAKAFYQSPKVFKAIQHAKEVIALAKETARLMQLDEFNAVFLEPLLNIKRQRTEEEKLQTAGFLASWLASKTNKEAGK
ncbi:hypothetical protein [Achromobacter phage Motura]|uniref:Uncharacterized protein n=1 Tax=Achromobacter phage Motura TaxID=2591403 RepID=A0A514CT78_9CAUD|nr:hypothetical protein H1O15_gp263 [Achromobacter phage Motura]QDH83698.1 hypothetical protein [Achromobacter phage Motura]